jgi:hypothetical protein
MVCWVQNELSAVQLAGVQLQGMWLADRVGVDAVSPFTYTAYQDVPFARDRHSKHWLKETILV